MGKPHNKTMKVKVLNADSLVPFSSLGVGQAWITKDADLKIVDTVYVKVSDTEYVELGGGYMWKWKATDVPQVRRVKITSVEVELA
jgi:hypothetical protein